MGKEEKREKFIPLGFNWSEIWKLASSPCSHQNFHRLIGLKCVKERVEEILKCRSEIGREKLRGNHRNSDLGVRVSRRRSAGCFCRVRAECFCDCQLYIRQNTRPGFSENEKHPVGFFHWTPTHFFSFLPFFTLLFPFSYSNTLKQRKKNIKMREKHIDTK